MFAAKKKVVFVSIILFSVFIVRHNTALAQICSGKDDCSQKIKEYEEKLAATRVQKNSLASQIDLMNTKIDLTRVRIENTQHIIIETQKEIEELGGKIERLNTSLNHLTQILLQKIVEGYKNKDIGVLEIFFAPDSTTLANQFKYIQIAQENDRRLAVQTQQIKVNYAQQKDLREVKKTELETLESQLQTQQQELDAQKTQKESLLEQTKSDEQRYQQLLSQALAEFEAINRAVKTGSKVGEVKKGDPIGLVGNSGYPFCSTGAHLHFEVRENGQWVDPGKYINGGPWSHPLTEPIILTQGFGVTPYSWRYAYSGGIHTGYDMVSKSSDVIRAPHDGTLFVSSQACGGAIINIKYIEHADGIVSYYLHVQ